MENKISLLSVFLFVIFITIFSTPLITGKVLLLDDLGLVNLPYRHFYSQCLENNLNFTWIPTIYCGFDLHGEGQVGLFHPWHLFLYSLFPLNMAFNLEIVANHVFIFIGMFLFLHVLGIKKGPSLIGALTLACSGFTLLHHVHPNMISVAAHLPWALCLIHLFFFDKSKKVIVKNMIHASIPLVTCSQILLGHPQILWINHFMEALFILFIFWTQQFKPFKRLFFYVWLKILGIMIGCLQLLPTLASTSLSLRDHLTLDFLYSFSLHPANLVQLISPYFYENRVVGDNAHESGIYCGALAFIAFVYFLFHFKKKNHLTHLERGAVILFLLSLILALGKYGYLYRLQVHIPLINSFRCSSRYIFLNHFASALLVALLFQTIINDRSTKPFLTNHLRRLLIILSAIITIIGLVIKSNSTAYLILGSFIFVMSIILIIKSHKKTTYLFLLPILMVLDQSFYGFSYIFSQKPMSIANYLGHFKGPTDKKNRIYGVSHMALTMKGYHLTGGISALVPKKEITEPSHQWLQIAGVGSIFQSHPPNPPAFAKTNISPLNYAYLVNKTRLTNNPQKDIRIIDPQATALVSDPEIQLDSNQPPGKVSLIEKSPGHIKLSLETPSTQLLSMSESYHPGWVAIINSQETKCLKVNGDFLGLVVPPGTHEITLSFKPPALTKGFTLSVVGLVLLMITLIINFCVKPNKN